MANPMQDATNGNLSNNNHLRNLLDYQSAKNLHNLRYLRENISYSHFHKKDKNDLSCLSYSPMIVS